MTPEMFAVALTLAGMLGTGIKALIDVSTHVSRIEFTVGQIDMDRLRTRAQISKVEECVIRQSEAINSINEWARKMEERTKTLEDVNNRQERTLTKILVLLDKDTSN